MFVFLTNTYISIILLLYKFCLVFTKNMSNQNLTVNLKVIYTQLYTILYSIHYFQYKIILHSLSSIVGYYIPLNLQVKLGMIYFFT